MPGCWKLCGIYSAFRTTDSCRWTSFQRGHSSIALLTKVEQFLVPCKSTSPFSSLSSPRQRMAKLDMPVNLSKNFYTCSRVHKTDPRSLKIKTSFCWFPFHVLTYCLSMTDPLIEQNIGASTLTPMTFALTASNRFEECHIIDNIQLNLFPCIILRQLK